MDYEKAYKELFGTVMEFYPEMSDFQKEKLDAICPCFADSNDERIRKSIVQTIEFARAHNLVGYTSAAEMKMWLEKQKNTEERYREYGRKEVVNATEVYGLQKSDIYIYIYIYIYITT